MDRAFPVLLIDAGNSRVKWARLEESGEQVRGGFFDRTLSGATEASLMAEWSAQPRPAAVWLSNVAGDALAERVGELIHRQWPGITCTTIKPCERQYGIVNHYQDPSRLGSDRWAGMIAAHARHPEETLLIATLGTATTIDAVTADGHFVGGLIAPGWSVMTRSLGDHTAQLPTLSVADLQVANEARAGARGPGQAFEQETTAALTEGCRLAQIGFIEHAWHTFSERRAEAVTCIVSGGAAHEVVDALSIPYVEHQNLVLDGLAHIALSDMRA